VTPTPQSAPARSFSERFERHRKAVLIGAGVLGGLAVLYVPPRGWSRLGAVLFGGGARLAQSAIGPVLIGAIWDGLKDPGPASGSAAAEPGSSNPGPTP
jgi:hypothetical protein